MSAVIPLDEAARVLGVRADAPHHAVKRQHRRLARATHPDRHPGIDPSRFRRVQEAFEAFELAWKAPPPTPDPLPEPAVHAVSVRQWLRAWGLDPVDLLRQVSADLRPPPGNRIHVGAACNAAIQAMRRDWATMPPRFEHWYQENILEGALKAWDDAWTHAVRSHELESVVLEVLDRHVIDRTPGLYRNGGRLLYLGHQLPRPVMSDEIRGVGLRRVVRNRVDHHLQAAVVEERRQIIQHLEKVLSDPIALIRQSSENRQLRFTPDRGFAV